MPAPKLSVAEALQAAALIDLSLAAFEETAPRAVAALGGREFLSRRSQMTCFGPVPRLTEEEWCSMSEEYEERRTHGDLAESHRALAPRGTARR